MSQIGMPQGLLYGEQDLNRDTLKSKIATWTKGPLKRYREPYLEVLTMINPVTYIVDLLRGLLIQLQYFGTVENILVMIGFTLVTLFIGTQAFERMRS